MNGRGSAVGDAYGTLQRDLSRFVVTAPLMIRELEIPEVM